MDLRFRRSVRLAPGLRLNLSKGGLSATLGQPDASANIGRRGTTATTSMGHPGTGLSRQSTITGRRGGPSVVGAVVVLIVLAVWLLG